MQRCLVINNTQRCCLSGSAIPEVSLSLAVYLTHRRFHHRFLSAIMIAQSTLRLEHLLQSQIPMTNISNVIQIGTGQARRGGRNCLKLNADFQSQICKRPDRWQIYEEGTLRIACLMGGSSHHSVHTGPPWSGILDDVFNGHGSRGQHCHWTL